MTVRYVGAGGNDANDGLSWANRKLTLNGAEDTPVIAGDTVYVGPGTYRELLTVDVSGTAGNPVAYVGDYDGSNTDGVGGIVRITGSNDNITPTRTTCITATTRRNYRTFRGFVLDLPTQDCINVTDGDHWTVDQCHLQSMGASRFGIVFQGANQAGHIVSNSYLHLVSGAIGVAFTTGADVNDTASVVRSCVFVGGASGVRSSNIGGIVVSNCVGIGVAVAFRVDTALAVGQTLTINNSAVQGCTTGFQATTLGELVENYNTIFGTSTARTNVSAGANSITYPWLADPRWFAEAANGGTLVTPFDLASYCTLVELNSGTGAPSTDLRGASATGTYREWGPLEYNAALAIEAGGGVTMWPLSQSFIQAIIGG